MKEPYYSAAKFARWIDRSGLSLTQAAAYLGVSRRQVARWKARGIFSSPSAMLVIEKDLRIPEHEEPGHVWSGEDAPVASRLAGGHVGGISAAISYGWTVEAPRYVAVYVDEKLEEGEVRTVAGGMDVRVMPRTLSPNVGVSVRRDGRGCTIRTSDPVRAVVECCLDPWLLGEPLEDIVRGSRRDGITEGMVLAHAALHGAEVLGIVMDALRVASRD